MPEFTYCPRCGCTRFDVPIFTTAEIDFKNSPGGDAQTVEPNGSFDEAAEVTCCECAETLALRECRHAEPYRADPPITPADDSALTADDIEDFSGYCQNATANQLQGILDKERNAGRRAYVAIVRAVATARGVALQ